MAETPHPPSSPSPQIFQSCAIRIGDITPQSHGQHILKERPDSTSIRPETPAVEFPNNGRPIFLNRQSICLCHKGTRPALVHSPYRSHKVINLILGVLHEIPKPRGLIHEISPHRNNCRALVHGTRQVPKHMFYNLLLSGARMHDVKHFYSGPRNPGPHCSARTAPPLPWQHE